MGTSMGVNPRTGRWALDCADCGHVGGVRKRHCPSGYCLSAQLCPVCYARERQSGEWARIHRDCARLHAEYVAAEAAKDAEPALWPRSAVGDWHADCPAGMVLVTTRARTLVVLPKADYDPSIRGFGTLPIG